MPDRHQQLVSAPANQCVACGDGGWEAPVLLAGVSARAARKLVAAGHAKRVLLQDLLPWSSGSPT